MPFRFIFFVSGGNEGEKQRINSLDSGMRRNDGNLEGVWAARELWGGHIGPPLRTSEPSLLLRQKCRPRRWMISIPPSSVVGIPPSSGGTIAHSSIATIAHSSIAIDPQGGSDSQPRHSGECRNPGGGEIHWFRSTLRLPPTCAGMTAISPSSPGLTTHLPAFAVLPEIAGFGIVRATRGNHSRCHAPSSGRAGMSCENRGGVLMESGDGTRVKTAIPRSGGRIPPSSVGIHPPAARLRAYTLALPTIPHSSIAIDPQGGSASLCHSGLIIVNRGGVLMDLKVTRIIKIIQFPVNIDKFTRFFDKYLKSGREEIT